MSNAARAAIGVAAIVVVVALFVILQGSDDSDSNAPATSTTTTNQAADAGAGQDQDKPDKPEEPAEPEVPTIVIKNGEPVGGVAELEFDTGDEIEFYVESDVADHVHLHVYDVMKDVAPGKRVKFSVPATIEGVFEAELEDSVVQIAQITVNPG